VAAVDRSERAWWYGRGLLLTVAVAGFVVAYQAMGWQAGAYGSDTWNYLAAGERVLAGHSAYALLPGDRPVPIVPPYWTVPMLAPPATLIPWAPLAVLGDASMTIWAIGNLLATAAAIAWLLHGRNLRVLGWIAVLSPALGLLAFSGNVNGFLLLGLVTVWARRDQPAIVGTILAAAIALKLTPVYLLYWLGATRRWRALVTTAVASLVIGALTIAVVGWDDVLAWFANVPASAPSPLSLAANLGISSLAVSVAFALALSIAALSGSDRWMWVLGVLAAALATPAFYFQAIALLAACAAPWTGARAPGGATSDNSRAELRRNPA
jgi:hypothetical protein